MRLNHIIAVAVVLVVAIGVKVSFFSPVAEANHEAQTHATMNVLQMHHDFPNMKNLPVQKVNDMTFVFTDAD